MTTDQPSLFDLDQGRQFHPIADRLIPITPADDETIHRIAESIQRRGLHEPITLAPDGRIIDGRLRYLACRRVGVEPAYETLPSFYTTDRMLADVFISKNLRRQHLTADQITEAVEAVDRLAAIRRRSQ